jgi:hypothetical protein
MTRFSKVALLVTAALSFAACGTGGSSSSSSAPSAPGVARGAITERSAGSITVNGVEFSTAGATVRIDDNPHPESDLRTGMVVTIRGSFDDRTGTAGEIEYEHGIEGQVDDKGTDFIVVGGQKVHVDDSTEFEHAGRMGSIVAGSSRVAISGVPDDRGGLRASRIEDSPRNDFEVKGFVSNASGSSFDLAVSPDATSHWIVNLGPGVALPANGSFVEVRSAAAPAPGTPPVLGTMTASAVQIEDRFGGAEVEIEGIVSSGSAPRFVIDGQTVRTSASTTWQLGTPADLLPGVKVEAEGHLASDGVLDAHRVSFRPGIRITANLENVSFDPGAGGTATILGIPVQLPSFARYDVAPASGTRVELRAMPSASGTGLVAFRVTADGSGNASRVFLRAVVTAKSNANPTAPTFGVLGFTITTAGASFKNLDGVSEMSPADFYTVVEAGRTVVKARASSIASVDAAGRTFAADEVELEGNR